MHWHCHSTSGSPWSSLCFEQSAFIFLGVPTALMIILALLTLGSHGSCIVVTLDLLLSTSTSTMQVTRTPTFVLTVTTHRDCCSSSGFSCWCLGTRHTFTWESRMVSMPSPPRPFILAPLHCFLASTALRSIHIKGKTNKKLDGPPRAVCLETRTISLIIPALVGLVQQYGPRANICTCNTPITRSHKKSFST